MVTAILAGILTVNTLNPHEMEYCTFSAGFSSSSKSLSSSSSLCPWLRAAKMFPPWKRPEMLYRESACECCWWRRSSRVFVSADKPFSYFLYWRQWLWNQKISTLKQRHTLYEEKEWYCFRNIPESSSLASTESFDSVNMTFSSSASSPFPFRRSFFFFWGLKKIQMLQVVRILKTLFLVLYLEFKTSLSLVTPVLFQQGLFNLQAGRWIAPSHAFEWAGIQCEKGWRGRGANKKNSLRDTISNSGKMFLSFCLC